MSRHPPVAITAKLLRIHRLHIILGIAENVARATLPDSTLCTRITVIVGDTRGVIPTVSMILIPQTAVIGFDFPSQVAHRYTISGQHRVEEHRPADGDQAQGKESAEQPVRRLRKDRWFSEHQSPTLD